MRIVAPGRQAEVNDLSVRGVAAGQTAVRLALFQAARWLEPAC
jgi:hypothetical protein